MIGARQSSPCMIFTILDSGLNVSMEGSSKAWKNTSGGSTAFLVAALASSCAYVFFVLSICSTVNPLK
jgi:hypothetical protein